jgi:hypothetical protein
MNAKPHSTRTPGFGIRRILLKYYKPRGFAGSASVKTALLEDFGRNRVLASTVLASSAILLAAVLVGIGWQLCAGIAHGLQLGWLAFLTAVGFILVACVVSAGRGAIQSGVMALLFEATFEDEAMDLIQKLLDASDSAGRK